MDTASDTQDIEAPSLPAATDQPEAEPLPEPETQDTLQDVQEDSPQDVQQDSLQDVQEDSPQDVQEDTPQDVSPEDAPQIEEQDAPQTVVQAAALVRPNLIVFLSNVCIMVLELVAERIIAPHVGVSLYTWTGIIGVVLAGISLGNYVGGQLADRRASRRLLGIVFLLGGLTSLGILGIDALDILTAIEWPLIVEILVLVSAMFFLPAAILGTVSPIVAKLAVRDLDRAGRTVGRIYAAGSMGSIIGTFATGFVLTSLLGTHIIVIGVAGLLLIIGLYFLLDK